MTTPLLETAARELAAAAAVAKVRADDNPFDPWSSLAATIELVAAGLSSLPTPPPSRRRDSSGHILEAARVLDAIPAAAAPTDLNFWKAHIADLHANAAELETRALAGSRSRP